jgi:ribosomal protein S18 acetylase RimI-like enzyme
MELKIDNNYTINDSFEKIDFNDLQELLKEAYWCRDISLEEVKKGASNSALVIGTYDNTGKIVGYMRVVSDKTRFAYIMDVYVDIPHRKKGIGKAMVKFSLEHPEFKDVYQWLLRTRDAHEVYKSVGFEVISDPEKWMSIIKPRPQR